MKRLLILACMMPGTVLAHGAHPPVPEAVHDASHIGPVAGLVLIAIVGGLALRQRLTS